MVNPSILPPDGTAPEAQDPARAALAALADQAGYTVIRTRTRENATVWTLSPHGSQVEFDLVGDPELRRFLASL